MRFLLDTEQAAFAASLDAMLTSANTPSVIRAWAEGDHAPGRALWSRLADAGVFALAIPEAYDGVGPLPVELVVAFVELGRHGVPGPLAETAAAAALLSGLDESGPAKRLLPTLASGEAMATVALAGGGPYVLDGDAANVHLAVRGTTAETAELHLTVPGATARTAELRPTHTPAAGVRGAPTPATAPPPDRGGGTSAGASEHAGPPPASGHAAPPPAPRPSLDPARRLTHPLPGGELLAGGPRVTRAAAHALAWARLATAAQALGVGLALLDRTVDHVKRRSQFGVPVGSFQAVKHQLADALIALEFARPLLFGAALSMTPADVAAAKVTACEAAYATARTALQLHGAIGYTAEYDLSLWLTKARALRTAWGTPAQCRAEVLSGGGPRW